MHPVCEVVVKVKSKVPAANTCVILSQPIPPVLSPKSQVQLLSPLAAVEAFTNVKLCGSHPE